MKQADLATAAGLSRETIARLEAQSRRARRTTVEALAAALGVAPAALSGEAPPTRQCIGCRETKPLNAFTPIRGTTRVYGRCRACRSVAARQRYRAMKAAREGAVASTEPAAVRPTVVLVSGAPASGKSTLARALARELRLPLLARDTITEALADSFQCASREVTQASFAAFWRLIADQVATGLGAVAETNLHRGVSEPAVRDLAQRAGVVLVHCTVARELSVRRFKERHERGERNACFEDGQRLASLQERGDNESWEQAQPLDLPLPLLVVDTTDGYNPTLSQIVRFVAQGPGKRR